MTEADRDALFRRWQNISMVVVVVATFTVVLVVRMLS
jgi:hypothetical protein